MPFPLPSRAAPGPRRRTLIASAAGAVLLVGCSGDPDGTGSGGRGASAEDRVRVRAARDSERLVERYDAVGAAHPGLAERLRPLRAEVVRHARAFGGGVPASAASASASASASDPVSTPASSPASDSPSGAPSARDTVPADPAAALAGLAAAERKLADRRIAALAGLAGETARLLASVAAAGAAHAYLLTKPEPKPDAGSASGTEERE
ncbi:hypothetical protein QFZ63_002556 [Streptomyces sp. B3I7]|uniref:hypothetical protein n=1 Tax=Streptomyces sp. B3I7 TaxID=3042269 RepID=UPI00277EEABD|nr:hypothetical protein [Streptomyces sp. B3I7]MDQ0810842.1 hypothetical protein [Streptomyces sp. B3I7]